MRKVRELRGIIYGLYDCESDLAKDLNWPRQRLSKITNGQKDPDVEEINILAKKLGKPVNVIVQIFLRYKSPNGQQDNRTSV